MGGGGGGRLGGHPCAPCQWAQRLEKDYWKTYRWRGQNKQLKEKQIAEQKSMRREILTSTQTTTVLMVARTLGEGEGYPVCARKQKAIMTNSHEQDDWLTDSLILGVLHHSLLIGDQEEITAYLHCSSWKKNTKSTCSNDLYWSHYETIFNFSALNNREVPWKVYGPCDLIWWSEEFIASTSTFILIDSKRTK